MMLEEVWDQRGESNGNLESTWWLKNNQRWRSIRESDNNGDSGNAEEGNLQFANLLN